MTSVAGSFCLALGIFAGLAATLLWARTATGRAPADQARLMTTATAVAALGACVALEVALVGNDFSLTYVAENSSRSTPLLYRVTALWSALDGSLLLWTGVLAAYAFAVSRIAPRAAVHLHPWACAVMSALTAAFFGLAMFGAHPFQTLSPSPGDGPGPNPLLADHPAMAVHPPLLYLGYVGLSVPFAYAVAALVAGDAGRGWLEVTRRWLLVAWVCLTAGIVLGAWWSYAVLGWGGYWAWDPVENASILPWLTGTALLHSALLQRRHRTVAVWNVSLAASTFVLVCVGTFLTRSGVVVSVHSFTQSALGPMLLGFLVLVLGTVVGLVIWRADSLRRSASVSTVEVGERDGILLLNNALLVGLAVTILFGTLLPVLSGLWGPAVSVGEPYFDRLAGPTALLLLVLMALAPVARWNGNAASLARHAAAPAALAAATAGVAGLAGAGGPLFVICLALAAAVAAMAAREIARQLRPLAARRLRPALRHCGGHVAHTGFALACVAIAASFGVSHSAEAQLSQGQSVAVSGVSARLVSVTQRAHGSQVQTTAELALSDRQGSSLGRMTPALVLYGDRGLTVSQPSIRTQAGSDTYLTLVAADPQATTATVRLAVNPLVGWLWVAGALMVLGALLAAIPVVRRTRRTVRPAVDVAAVESVAGVESRP
jgi:cytochrome c-type biogenesis protein CcmF